MATETKPPNKLRKSSIPTEPEARQDAEDIAVAERVLATEDPSQRKTLEDLRRHLGR